MAMKYLESLTDEITDIRNRLSMIDFEIPSEPTDDEDTEAWREYGQALADKLSDIENDVTKAVDEIEA
ncbi:hypothetical protein SCH4B_4356 [Ruegeria sp. TrichCH4B]|nr:hypothetical protein SCH4B_4356 [Ruegeria sp. TrichCH4B]